MLEVAEKRQNRIHSLVGVAIEADFADRLANSSEQVSVIEV